jgi:hypothetical protein
MFSVLLQRTGNPISGEIPVEEGPRQFGQFSAWTADVSPMVRITTSLKLRINVIS